MSADTQREATPADVAFIIALAGGETVRAAAATAGISERTAYRRMATPAFRKELALMRAVAFDEAAAQLARASVKAARVVVALLDNPDPKIRLQAAKQATSMATEVGEAGRHLHAVVANAGLVGLCLNDAEVMALLPTVEEQNRLLLEVATPVG